jgi:hypothetical protein
MRCFQKSVLTYREAENRINKTEQVGLGGFFPVVSLHPLPWSLAVHFSSLLEF